MPTPDEYRSARCLLGLTQHQVGKMMKIRRETVGQLESINPDTPRTWEAYSRYYDVWLREYARIKHPDLLFAVEAILNGNRTVIAWLGEQADPDSDARHGRHRPNRIVELNLVFSTIMETSQYLIKHGYTDKDPHTVQTKISQILNGYRKQQTLCGFHFEDV